MQIPKVSVIIPVYNTEKYVRQAVESIRRQTLKDIEIIIVNDGSTDGSMTILEELAAQDERIKLFSQENQGQSAARNFAIQKAKGKYFYFMDSDDFLEKDALQLCFEKAKHNNLDFVLFDADILNPQDTTAIDLTYQRTQIMDEESIYTGSELLNLFIRKYIFTPSPCLSFINTTFFRQKNLSFYPGIIHEDQLFTCKLYLNANKVMCIAKPFFKRRFRSDSTMTNRFAWKNMRGYLTVTAELLQYASKHPEYKKLIDLFLSQMLDASVWQAHVLPLKEKIKLLPRIAKHHQYIRLRTWLVLMLKK
ncbi:glycosyltransferase family 2 protein [uncultured Bacteroides sp.]|uniref:glycosyltransferase family 2 protein n=1 Tax=uncultured Bacteroides sp. TaxID=162156 RepID=UPI00280BCFF1|nr:glycosyltransferase family 2 protein [uncultured Bacteroides sp.]